MTMLISKIHLPRRTVLKALGATVGLPLLDAMIPAGTALGKTASAAQRTATFVYFPHGAVMEQWTPRGAGTDFELGSILAPLAPYREQLTVVSGLENRCAIAPPVHALTPATWLTCTLPKPSSGASVDQLIAAKLSQDTPLPSLQVATEEHGGEGCADRVYGDTYAKTLSIDASGTPLGMEHDPRKVFARLFATEVLSRHSVLDWVREDARTLSRRLGPRDRATLDDYLANVRELERRVQRRATALDGASVDAPMRFDEHVSLMFDLIALAYQAGLTRVATIMMAAEVSNQTYDFIGVPDSFHALSHHGNSPAKLQRLAQIQTYNTRLFARFVGKLAQMPDGDGSMLDHALMVYGSNMSNSNLHDHSRLPTALLGGALRGNRHLRCADPTPLANLHVALLNTVGLPVAAFGDSRGALAI